MDIEKKLKELREKRNKLSKEASDYQDEIDRLELEKHDTQRFLGKILDLSEVMMVRSCKVWLYVTSIERLFEGPRFHGIMIRVGKDMQGKITFIEVANDASRTKKWGELKDLRIEESPEKVMKYFQDSLGNIDLGNVFKIM